MNRSPSRILLLKPCCIGDVVLTTPLLLALHRAYPESQIDWMVGTSSAAAIAQHALLHQAIECGARANPASTIPGLIGLARQMRSGKYDLLVAPERSPLISLAAWLSGIPKRAGLDSAGRGFGYTIRAPINPSEVRHEAQIYLDVARALNIPTEDCWANIVPNDRARTEVSQVLSARNVPPEKPLIVVHPGGGVNPGMTLTSKRWPPDRFATLAQKVANFVNGHIIVLGSRDDRSVTDAVLSRLDMATDLTDGLTIPQIAALPRVALYLSNDTGLTHLAAAAGMPVLMIFGPSDPRRYAPFVPPERAAFAWRPVAVPERGVVAGGAPGFDWERDGVSVDEAWDRARSLVVMS